MSPEILLGEAALQLPGLILGDALKDERSHFVGAVTIDSALGCCGVQEKKGEGHWVLLFVEHIISLPLGHSKVKI